MIMRAADYGRTCEAKKELMKKITVEEQAAKRARESIEEQQKKLKDAELQIKRLKTDFVKLHGEVDAKKRKLEEEMAVVFASRKSIILNMNSTYL
jgi:predicted  nucleic acid-binding Zn-ribbon protein